MRRAVHVAAVSALACSVGACAMLSGLDQLQKDDCAVNACADGAAGADVAADGGVPESRLDASPDATAAMTDGAPEADATSPADVTSPEAGADASAPDAVDTGAPDTGPCGTVYFSEPFAGNAQGWTLDSTWSIARECASPPTPQKGFPDPTTDHTSTAGSGVAGVYVCGNNPAGQTAAFRYATSPAVNVAAAPSLKLAFYRWLNTDSAGWMASTVDVFDGSAWVNVYTNPAGAGNLVSDSAWTKIEYDVTAHKNAAFRVRFGYAIVNAGVYQVSCWNVDDVTLSSASCP